MAGQRYQKTLEKTDFDGNISTVKIKKEPITEFIMEFREASLELLKITKLNHRKVFDAICRRVEYNTNTAYLTSQVKEDIAQEIGTTVDQVYKAVSALKKLSLIFVSKGNVIVNPRIIWFGEIKLRKEALKHLADKNLKSFANLE